MTDAPSRGKVKGKVVEKAPRLPPDATGVKGNLSAASSAPLSFHGSKRDARTFLRAGNAFFRIARSAAPRNCETGLQSGVRLGEKFAPPLEATGVQAGHRPGRAARVLGD